MFSNAKINKLNVTVPSGSSSTAYWPDELDSTWKSDKDRPSIYDFDNKRTFSSLWDSSISKDCIGKKGGHQR